MKELTQKQVEEFMATWSTGRGGGFEPLTCTATLSDGGVWTLEFKQMYEYIEYTAEDLFNICEFFDTMNVNDSRYSIGGCDSCDYGSSYEVTFTVADGKPFPKSV